MVGNNAKKLILLRHAKSAWPAVPDHERPLAGRGRRDAPAMGRWLRDAGHAPDHVVCSTARRARETWELVRDGLQATPSVTFDDRVYQASPAELLGLVRSAAAATRTLLIVGHDPAIPELAVTLADAAANSDAERSAAVNRMTAKFPTAAVAILQGTGSWGRLRPGSMRLTWFVTPRDLRTSGTPGSKAK